MPSCFNIHQAASIATAGISDETRERTGADMVGVVFTFEVNTGPTRGAATGEGSVIGFGVEYA